MGALRRLGFTIKHQDSDVVVLERTYRAVVVPTSGSLSRETLTSVLSAAGLAWGDFTALLDGVDPAEIGRTRSGMRPRSEPPLEE